MDDPDADAEPNVSTIFQTIFVIVAFSACHYKEDKHVVTPLMMAPEKIKEQKKTPLKKESRVLKKKKTIYLTFDDGPNRGTKNVLHIAGMEKMPVTFFLIGEQVYASHWQAALYDSILHRSLTEIQNHSYTHAHHKYNEFYSSASAVVQDFNRCADSLKLLSNIIRTPGRNIWRTQNISSTDIKESSAAADSLRTSGYALIGWDAEWQYNNQMKLEKNCDEMMVQIDSIFAKDKTKTSGHLVLLAHDQVYTDVNDSAALHDFIKKIKSRDEFDFEMISNYPGLKN